MQFKNREAAGRKLANALQQFRDKSTVVLALPRGGVVVGSVVADALAAPLGVLLVYKIGDPSNPEYALGAVAEGGKTVFNETATRNLGDEWMKEAVVRAQQVISHRQRLYSDSCYVPPDVENKTVFVVDDGIATDLTMRAALLALRSRHPKRVIVAAPVASKEAVATLRQIANAVIVLGNNLWGAVGAHYLDFPQVGDTAVKQLLGRRQTNDLRQTATINA